MYISYPSASLPDKITMVIELTFATRYIKMCVFQVRSNANFHFECTDTFPQNRHHKNK